MKLHIQTVLLPLLLACSFSGFTAQKSETELNVKPTICTVKYRGDSCALDLSAYWKAISPTSCCLYAEDDELSCWDKQLSGKKQFNVEFDSQLEVELIDVDTEQAIGSETISVQAQNSTRYRHRLKMPWSVF